jgi:steroid delta-isomerase-like uncharacterized protein
MDKAVFLFSFMDEVWNKKKLDKVEKYIHKEYHIHLDPADPWEGKTLSHEEFKKRLNFSFESFPDINFEIVSSIVEENHVAITWLLRGTNLGPIAGMPATNQSVKTKGMTIYHFKDDLISGHTQIFDRRTVMKQLGF